MTGMETVSMMPCTMSGSLIRDTPPWARMSAGTRSSAMTATAPASSAIFACSGVTTSMMTPPLSISAMPRLTRAVPISGVLAVCSDCADIRDLVRTQGWAIGWGSPGSRRLQEGYPSPAGRPDDACAQARTALVLLLTRTTQIWPAANGTSCPSAPVNVVPEVSDVRVQVTA